MNIYPKKFCLNSSSFVNSYTVLLVISIDIPRKKMDFEL